MKIPIPSPDLLFALDNPQSEPERAIQLVPKLAKRVQELAEETMRLLMIELTRRYTGNPPTKTTSFELWQALQEGPNSLSESEATTLDGLSYEAGGWIEFHDGEPEDGAFIPHIEWAPRYDQWRMRQEAKDAQ